MLRILGIVPFVTAMMLVSTEANAVFWRGVTAPTNIDTHGWPIIKEPYPSSCQLIHVNGYWVRQCLDLGRRYQR